jgi:pimeloyl-ACP methyl ester carboxylesterase
MKRIDPDQLQYLTLSDGRRLEFYTSGDSGPAILFHHGTAGDASMAGVLADVVDRHGARLISFSRPGYGNSDSLPGRSVSYCVNDIQELFQALDIGQFVTVGWSAGAPHGLALAAGMPEQCRGVAAVACVGVKDEHFAEGMSDLTLGVLDLAMHNEPALRQWIAENQAMLLVENGRVLEETMAPLLSEPDRVAMSEGLSDYLAESFRRGMTGIEGWVGDQLTLVNDWGFSLEDIGCSVSYWCGDQDTIIPDSHSFRLAQATPVSALHHCNQEGHYSILWNRREKIICDLLNKF